MRTGIIDGHWAASLPALGAGESVDRAVATKAAALLLLCLGRPVEEDPTRVAGGRPVLPGKQIITS